MVKINISIEGEDMEEIFTEMISFGMKSIKSNKGEMKELIEFFDNPVCLMETQRNYWLDVKSEIEKIKE